MHGESGVVTREQPVTHNSNIIKGQSLICHQIILNTCITMRIFLLFVPFKIVSMVRDCGQFPFKYWIYISVLCPLFFSYSGLNFLDLMVRQGTIDNPPKPPIIPGFECSGIVESVGENVTGFEVNEIQQICNAEIY